ncbi:hypothetical protein DL96DRAFT_1580361 [Flagelloscypha sp. PMI_526]|nr:hypothetical protein DL96DRAFT_1580361 [Flagelloscypha sp. PMI_526]
MPMDVSDYIGQLGTAILANNAHGLSYLLTAIDSSHGKELGKSYRKGLDKSYLLRMYRGSIQHPWDDIAVEFACACTHLSLKKWKEAFVEYDSLVSNFGKFFSENSGWTLVALFKLLTELRFLALKADEWEKINQNKRNQDNMRKAATTIQPFLSKCIQDRTSPLDFSRRWGVYFVVNQTFKCYSRVQTLNLARNILKAVNNSPDIPPLSSYPRSHRVTYKYYLGMIAFYNQDFHKSESELTEAFYNSYIPESSNQRRILTHLIPLRLLKGHLPTQELLERFPVLYELYEPFVKSIRSGDVSGYDRALEEKEHLLLGMDLWLIMERAREVCLRGLFRKVWKVSPTPTRIPISSFQTALRLSGTKNNDIDLEETECLVATMIYKGYLKGYISHEKSMVVLSPTNAFPRPAERGAVFSII